MKNSLRYILIALIIIVTSCSDDFLDEVSKGKLTDSNYWNTEQDALTGIRAAYHQAAGSWTGYSLWHIVIEDLGVDYGVGGWFAINAYTSYTGWSATTPDFIDWGIYPQFWNMIEKANTVLDKIPDMDISATTKNRIIGEAHGLRALGYFTLINWFGSQPEVTDANDLRFEIPRESLESNYKLIENDLLAAAAALPLKSELVAAGETEYGRLTKGAVQSLLVKVFLEQNKWKEAADTALEIIKSKEYELEADYLGSFSLNKEGFTNKEDIWSIPFVTGTSPEIPAQILQVYLYKANEINGYGQYFDWGGNIRATTDFYNSFEQGDLRRKGLFYSNDGAASGIKDPVMLIKHPADPSSEGVMSGNDYRFIRYADVILMRAEALNKLGDISGAIDEINKVRNRAQLSPLDASKFDSAKLHDQIFNERRWELYFEGHGKRDMKRMKPSMLIDHIESVSGDWKTTGAERYLLLPVPARAISSNPVMTQNPGF